MNKSTDGWTTVRRDGGASGYRRWGDRNDSAAATPSREMPSAFGGGDRMSSRREEEARRAWEDRRAAVEKERAAKAEAERQAKLRDFTNTEQYPALGGAGAAAAPKPKALNFRDIAHETAARSALEEAEAAAAVKRRELEASRRVYATAPSWAAGGPRLYRHGSYDDGPVDHDFPDEEGYYPPDEYAAAPHDHAYPEADEHGADAEAEAEFNSHLAVNRRRGDKSDW